MKHQILSLVILSLFTTSASADVLGFISDVAEKGHEKNHGIQFAGTITSYAFSKTALVYEFDEYSAIFKDDYKRITEIETTIKSTDLEIHKAKQKMKLLKVDKSKYKEVEVLEKHIAKLKRKMPLFQESLDDAVRVYSETVRVGVRTKFKEAFFSETERAHFKRAKLFKYLGHFLVASSVILGADLILQYLLAARDVSVSDEEELMEANTFIQATKEQMEEAKAAPYVDTENAEISF